MLINEMHTVSMSEWHDNQKKPSSDWRTKLQARIEANTPKRRKLTDDEWQRRTKLKDIAAQLRGKKTTKPSTQTLAYR